ncbi:hypothetical protein [Candidatus Palauibacter sp.]|uniref:hypothetical protein n=1 Tax=Candidatus Palauibacter sp. TaxID=3101350 RepID=UPI003B01C984
MSCIRDNFMSGNRRNLAIVAGARFRRWETMASGSMLLARCRSPICIVLSGKLCAARQFVQDREFMAGVRLAPPASHPTRDSELLPGAVDLAS